MPNGLPMGCRLIPLVQNYADDVVTGTPRIHPYLLPFSQVTELDSA